MIAGIGLAIALIVALLNLAKRVYELVFLYLTLPFSMSTICVDDGARFKLWRETFITKIVLAYGSVFSVNIFILLLPILSSMRLQNVGSFGNATFLIFMILGGAMVIPAGQTLFARLFGNADDMRVSSSFLHSAYNGARFMSLMSLGVAHKLLRGTFHVGKGLLRGKNAVCYTGFEKELDGAHILDRPAVRDGNIVTGWGAGGAMDFALLYLETLYDNAEIAKKIARSMRYGTY